MNCFWVKKYNIKIGITAITAPAIIKFRLCPASPIKLYKPTAIGRQSGVLVTSIGQASAFQVPMNESTMITIIGAFDKGSTTFHKKRRWPAPSIWAASKSSSGTCAKNCRNKNMEKTLPIKGIVKAGQLFIHLSGPIRPNHVTVRKLGMMITIAGIIMVLNSKVNIMSRPGNLIRANAYAARVLKVNSPARVNNVILVLFQIYKEKSASFQALMKFSKCNSEGIKRVPWASPRVITDVESIQKNGKIAMITPAVKKRYVDIFLKINQRGLRWLRLTE